MAILSVDPSTLTVSDLYDKKKFDINTMDNKLVFHILQTSPEGLTQTEAAVRIEKFGLNKLPEKKVNPILEILSFMRNPLTCITVTAPIVAITLSNSQEISSLWKSFVGIIMFLLGNSYIGYYQKINSNKAAESLMTMLMPQCKAKRDGEWNKIDVCNLVPGDIISIRIGDVIPADLRMVSSSNIEVDQAAITGESNLVSKDVGDEILSGSMVRKGRGVALVVGTGSNTVFGHAASLIVDANKGTGHLQQVSTKVGNFCICSIAIFLIAEIFVMFFGTNFVYHRGIKNMLVLLIGGIPIAMPTILSTMLVIGAKQLKKHNVIVTRISAIEDLAGVTILCSDKTGTLTQNKLTIKKDSAKLYSNVSIDDTLLWAAYASRVNNQDAIDGSIVDSLPHANIAREGIDEIEFQPWGPINHRTQMTFRRHSDNTVHRVTKGGVHIIQKLCTKHMTSELESQLQADIDEFARRGFRTLAVAEEEVPSGELEGEGTGFRLIGLLPIFDPLRHDTKRMIDHVIDLGMHVKMITGDQLAIAKETGRELGMGDTMYKASVLDNAKEIQKIANSVDELVLHADGFSGAHLEHKYKIVERLQKLGHIVAMMGDGSNDAPALAKANIGIAVANASDATRFAADIVLSEAGLSAVIKAFMISRVIFQRMRNYLIHMCAVTICVVTTFSILALAFNFDFSPSMMLMIASINVILMMTISTDRIKPSQYPNVWNMFEIFSYAIVYGCYLTLSNLVFFIVAVKSDVFQRYGSKAFADHNDFSLQSVIYLQVSILLQAIIFVVRVKSFFFTERPSSFLMCAFVIAQCVATIIVVYSVFS
ncbi:plasma membrane ATPase 1 [Coemansia reversa NRRL 1564]|uniref:Plasma membrane ATPase n=1 Tax=Coemansia reversa (strain ATCC 12441 / NRRL 1564) TaxID=763665 RepID=A0A2G5BB84_COERN|nr:plasma membrane ATPase 1 [Coemansia reversa NRRL 1564]|eukprot:PIA16271.1 plasma membrane ATPase 1 [Coemansia reversa NRRL 1564]